ncbi:unnamed protein product [Adineta ricciae]|nr:unnamed protein product [Adineta ricciae]
MSYLERLDLYIQFGNNTTIIDGNYLKRKIINANTLRNLQEFRFSITSRISSPVQLNLPSTKDIEQTFTHFKSKNIISCVDYFPERKEGQYHIYSYPYETKYYNDITNKFPGGIYEYVREVSLFDEKPFEHEFFLQIQKSFPFMEILSVKNKKAQNHKESNENLSLIQYSFLRELHIYNVHDDYIEEFLSDKKTSLSRNVNLNIKYESLERVTNNFTREDTRINCRKVDKLYVCKGSKRCNFLEEYFPSAKIIERSRF